MSFAQNALWLKLTNVRDRFYANKCPRSQKYSSFRVGGKREGQERRDTCVILSLHFCRIVAVCGAP